LIQDRVRNEINIVMQENGRKFTTKSLKDLSYLNRCIKESLRLYPSAFLISRVIEEDVKLRTHLTNLLLLYTLFKYIINMLLKIKYIKHIFLFQEIKKYQHFR